MKKLKFKLLDTCAYFKTKDFLNTKQKGNFLINILLGIVITVLIFVTVQAGTRTAMSTFITKLSTWIGSIESKMFPTT